MKGNRFLNSAKGIMPKFLVRLFYEHAEPAVFIFWITIPQQLSSLRQPSDHYFYYLSCMDVAADILKVLLAGKIRNRLTPHNIHIINRINGIILIVFGLP